VAPTLAVLLGTNIPASSQGRPLVEMLNVSPEAAAQAQAAVEVQQAALGTAYADAIGQPVQVPAGAAGVAATQAAMDRARFGKLAGERVWRNMIALFLAIVPGYWLILQKNKRALWPFAGGLVYLGLFLLRYLVLDHKTFGVSSIPGQTEFILYVAFTASVALVLGWLVSMLGLRAFRTGTRKAAGSALASVWFVLYLLALPILLNLAVNGLLPTWTLPEFTVQFLGFFAVVQALFVAVVGLLLVGVSALAGKFSKRT
jgi:hypothetical protein